MNPNFQIVDFLKNILQRHVDEKAYDWLNQKQDKISQSTTLTAFFHAFSQASRFFPKAVLQLDSREIHQLNEWEIGLQLTHWTVLQTARTVLMGHFLEVHSDREDAIHQLFETGDLHEQQALFAALPLFPNPENWLGRAIDGCRTNITSVFDAIALNNPYPARYFPELNWNQLILKAVFMQRPLYRIYGLDERRNFALAEIASDFAHERWAAGRRVMPELWRLLIPYLDRPDFRKDLERVLHAELRIEQLAAGLCLTQSPDSEIRAQLEQYPDLKRQLESEKIHWEGIGQDFQKNFS